MIANLSASKTDRFFREDSNGKDYRTAFQIDRDRLLYATEIARLAEITQVVSADHGYVFHNRLTHSLKVAQLSRRIAEKLIKDESEAVTAAGGLDPDAAEAAALAHDMGHPPFGHVVEKRLQKLAKDQNLQDSFEGNAQSFRLVTKLCVGDGISNEASSRQVRGLNLTRRTLNGVLKYPWIFTSEDSKKWGAYESEREIFEFAREGFAFGEKIKSLEAEVMDWSDDITYAVHDLIDFFCAGKIPLELLRAAGDNGEAEKSAFLENLFLRNKITDQSKKDSYKQSFVSLVSLFPLDRRYQGTFEERWNLWQYVTMLITRYVNAIHVSENPTPNQPLVTFEDQSKDEVFILKQLTWHYVIENVDLVSQQRGQIHMVDIVFGILVQAAKSKEYRLFPTSYEALLQDAAKRGPDAEIRVVVDYISSMTEKELEIVYSRFHGLR